MFARQAELDQQFETGQGRGARAAGDQLHLVELLADDLQSIQDRRSHDDRRAVLVIVEHRDLQAVTQLALDIETLRRLDVLEVDAAEGRFERGDHLDQPVGVQLVELDVEDIDASELLEEDCLAFHDWLGSKRSDVSQS